MEVHAPFDLACFFVFVLLLVKAYKRSKDAARLPPGPWKLPLIGSIHHVLCSLLHHRLRDLARKHGPLMHLQLGEVSTVVVSSSRMAKEVMKVHDTAFAERPHLLALRVMVYDYSDMIFAPYGDFWRQMRKICVAELFSAKRVSSFSHIREAEVHRLAASIRSSEGQPIDLTEKIYSMTSNIISSAAFGKIFLGQNTLINLVNEVFELSSRLNVDDWFPSLKFLHHLGGRIPKLVEMHKKLDEIFEIIIQEHLENPADSTTREEDVIDALLRVKESGGLEFPVQNKHIKAIIFDILSAGIDTSSSILEWAMAEMMRNSRVMEKAQTELRQALQGRDTIHEIDIKNLSYLKWVVKEAMRLHPPLPLIIRRCREQCEIDGYSIPIKSKIIINAWAIGRDPEYWDDAESFVPERFQDNPADYFTGTCFQYLPFGAGRRMCPGISLGLLNIELPLAQLLYHFNWDPPNGIKPTDLDMSERVGLTVHRRDHLHLIAKSVY